MKCNCKKGVWRDNCPECEGTGIRIDWRKFHRKKQLKKWSTADVVNALFDKGFQQYHKNRKSI